MPNPARASSARSWQISSTGISLRLFKPWCEPSLPTTSPPQSSFRLLAARAEPGAPLASDQTGAPPFSPHHRPPALVLRRPTQNHQGVPSASLITPDPSCLNSRWNRQSRRLLWCTPAEEDADDAIRPPPSEPRVWVASPWCAQPIPTISQLHHHL